MPESRTVTLIVAVSPLLLGVGPIWDACLACSTVQPMVVASHSAGNFILSLLAREPPCLGAGPVVHPHLMPRYVCRPKPGKWDWLFRVLVCWYCMWRAHAGVLVRTGL